MKCSYCGRTIPKSSLKCFNCGRVVSANDFNQYKNFEESKKFQKLAEKQQEEEMIYREKTPSYLKMYFILGLSVLFVVVLIIVVLLNSRR